MAAPATKSPPDSGASALRSLAAGARVLAVPVRGSAGQNLPSVLRTETGAGTAAAAAATRILAHDPDAHVIGAWKARDTWRPVVSWHPVSPAGRARVPRIDYLGGRSGNVSLSDAQLDSARYAIASWPARRKAAAATAASVAQDAAHLASAVAMHRGDDDDPAAALAAARQRAATADALEGLDSAGTQIVVVPLTSLAGPQLQALVMVGPLELEEANALARVLSGAGR